MGVDCQKFCKRLVICRKRRKDKLPFGTAHKFQRRGGGNPSDAFNPVSLLHSIHPVLHTIFCNYYIFLNYMIRQQMWITAQSNQACDEQANVYT